MAEGHVTWLSRRGAVTDVSHVTGQADNQGGGVPVIVNAAHLSSRQKQTMAAHLLTLTAHTRAYTVGHLDFHKNLTRIDTQTWKKCQAHQALLEDFNTKFTHSVDIFNAKFTLECREFNYFF